MKNSSRLFCPFLVFTLLSCFLQDAHSQVYRFDTDILNTRLAKASLSVVDSTTRKPISFASVFLVPLKDTTITHFGLTDTLGKASLKDIPFGGYTLNIEMMGYVPYRREKYFRSGSENLGIIALRVDQNFIEAAVVSDIGNSITIAQDTVTINATAFRVGSGAMLRDLLRTMPGMEVGNDGTVKFNGETIDKITVGGRTFFFNDKSAALNNLPAGIIDKIHIIDEKSDREKMTGLADNNKKKVMDVELKKEFQEGWFGNVRALGGTTLGTNGETERFDTQRPTALFNTNAMVAGYNEKDQVTLLGNASNVDYGNGGAVIVLNGSTGSLTQDEASSIGGLSTPWKGGVNFTTSRIPDYESSAALNVSGETNADEVIKSRTTTTSEGDILQDTRTSRDQVIRSYGADIELKNQKSKKYYLNFSASANRTFGSLNTREDISTTAGSLSTTGNNLAGGNSMKNAIGGSLNFGLKNLGAKRRSLTLNLGAKYQDLDGTSRTVSSLTGPSPFSPSAPRDISYVNSGTFHSLSAGLSYQEPIAKNFTLTLSADYSTLSKTVGKEATFTSNGASDPTSSSYSEDEQKRLSGRLGVQYQKKGFSTSVGINAQGLEEDVVTKNGNISTSYHGDMALTLAPTLTLIYTKKGTNATFYISGFNSTVPQTSRSISLDTGNLSSLHTGNPYLREPFNYSAFGQLSLNDPKTLRNAFVYLSLDMVSNPLTTARWYSPSGALNYFPVNSTMPTFRGMLQVSLSTPVNAKKTLSLELNGNLTYSSESYYTNKGRVESFDPENFDHSRFMEKFWGDEDGSIFYGTGSSFMKMDTRNLRPSLTLRMKANLEGVVINAGATGSAQFSNYGTAVRGTRTFRLRPFANATYITKWDMDFDTDIAYNQYWGYAQGYTRPELIWNFTVNKSVKAFTFTLSLRDILAQTYSMDHVVSDGYVEDSLRLILGRYFLAGIKWNFGKMNQAQAARARSAQLNLPINL